MPHEFETTVSSSNQNLVPPVSISNVEVSTSMSCKRDRSKLEDDEPVFMSRDEIERFSPSRKDGIDALREHICDIHIVHSFKILDCGLNCHKPLLALPWFCAIVFLFGDHMLAMTDF